jgi:hypothetical protein
MPDTEPIEELGILLYPRPLQGAVLAADIMVVKKEKMKSSQRRLRGGGCSKLTDESRCS